MISSNDPYGSETFGRDLGASWGLPLLCVGPCGHINADSQLGLWPAGLELVRDLQAGLARGGARA